MFEKADQGPNELQTLLRAIATMSCEVAEQLEENSSGIGHDLMKAGGVNKEVMVRLQAFDRMHQELDVISDVLDTPQSVPAVTVGAAYGDALLAAIGIGAVRPDEDWSRAGRIVEPSDDRSIYDLLHHASRA